VEAGACVPLAMLPPQQVVQPPSGRASVATSVSWDDVLDTSLTTGPARLLTYRVELRNNSASNGGRSAGYSDAAYAAAGAAPLAVEGLTAQGSRLGIVLSWKPAEGEPDEVVLRREDMRREESGAKPSKPIKGDAANVVWLRTSTVEPGGEGTLQAADPSAPKNITLDSTALAETPYLYSAERRRRVSLGGRTLELRSAPSSTVAFTLHAIYPAPAPTDLNGTSFAAAPPETGALVDLIWQSVDDPNLAGYNVYREKLASEGQAEAKQRLNQSPIPLPAFHDHLAPGAAAQRFRYSVTAVNKKGLESAAAAITVVVSEP
jgi:hypothetical protein